MTLCTASGTRPTTNSMTGVASVPRCRDSLPVIVPAAVDQRVAGGAEVPRQTSPRIVGCQPLQTPMRTLCRLDSRADRLSGYMEVSYARCGHLIGGRI